MTSNASWSDRAQRSLMSNYTRAPIAFAKGRGSTLWDVQGNPFIDFCAGVAVCSTGHAHPKVARAIAEQSARLMHTSNLYVVPQQVELAERLAKLSGLGGGAFFCNSGAEAVEAALKLARAWGRRRDRTDIIATENAFHGRTMGALGATGQPHYSQPFEPLVPGISHVPFGDAAAVAAAVTERTCAVLVEPIQGEGGIVVPPDDYLRQLRTLCDENDLLLLLDEVQTGIGRTGSWFAYEAAGIVPDAVALAKGLGSGFPIGALLASERAAAFEPGHHASTFGGNPVACAAALATLDVLQDEDAIANATSVGKRIMDALKSTDASVLGTPRGRGLLIGVDVRRGAAAPLVSRLMSAGLLTSSAGKRALRLTPPLVISDEEAARGLEILLDGIKGDQEATSAASSDAG